MNIGFGRASASIMTICSSSYFSSFSLFPLFLFCSNSLSLFIYFLDFLWLVIKAFFSRVFLKKEFHPQRKSNVGVQKQTQYHQRGT